MLFIQADWTQLRRLLAPTTEGTVKKASAVNVAVARARRRTLARTLPVVRRVYQRDARRASPKRTGRLRRNIRMKTIRFRGPEGGGKVIVQNDVPYFHATLARRDWLTPVRDKVIDSPEVRAAIDRFWNDTLQEELDKLP